MKTTNKSLYLEDMHSYNGRLLSDIINLFCVYFSCFILIFFLGYYMMVNKVVYKLVRILMFAKLMASCILCSLGINSVVSYTRHVSVFGRHFVDI